MAGTFAIYHTFYGDTLYTVPQNPGNFIVRWDGNQWRQLATGIMEGGASDVFVYDSILYCSTFAGHEDFHQFGDAFIPYFAGWDGNQWCGTPFKSGYAPARFGVLNGTLYMSFYGPTTVDGVAVSYLNYFDGDYLHGPGSVCSTYGLNDIEEPVLKNAIKFYPNPVTDVLKLEFSGKIHFLNIFDMTGRPVFKYSYKIDSEVSEIDMSELPPSLYMIEVNGYYYQKILKI